MVMCSTLFDEIVDVERLPIRARLASARASVVLPAAMKPTRYNLVAFHAVSRSSVSKKPGYEMATASLPVIVEGPGCAKRGDRQRHGDSVDRRGHAPTTRRDAGTVDREAVGRFIRRDSKITQPGYERGDPSRFP